MNKTLKSYAVMSIIGMGIGTANVIPGVSGATIAIITGVFERLINAVKSFDMTALRHLCSGQFREFSRHVDLPFLFPLLFGVALAIVSLAKLLEYLFSSYPVYTWAYFFGLILASIYFVGKTVNKWTLLNITLCISGAAFAIALTYLNPSVENRSILYVFVCGVIAICSMILPGISGSFILILMGNYELVVLEAINQVKLSILVPFLGGCGVGLVGFSHLLSWIMKRYKHETIAALTGFICGSLIIIWPWQEAIYRLTESGEPIMKHGEAVVFKYQPFLPDSFSAEVMVAIAVAAIGVASIWIMETLAKKSK
jgi:putative membrane protein